MAGWRGGGAALTALRDTAQHWLDELKDAFYALDHAQRAVRTSVEAYQRILPDRASTTGLVPRWRIVDGEADVLVNDYLTLVDRYPSVDGLGEHDLRQSGYEYGQLAPRLRAMAAQLDGLSETWSGELVLLGRETRKAEDQRAAAATAVAEAQRLWEGLRATGLESPAADTAFAKARVAQRGVEAWTPDGGLPRLRELVALVQGFVDQVRQEVEAFPAQVERARRRTPSLRTRLDAVETRAERIAADLGVLRREFSAPNWTDLEGRDRMVSELVSTARSQVDQLAEATRRESWPEAVALLAEAEAAVDAADDAVDEPHERLAALRSVKSDPSSRLGKVRFAIKDAQTLVVRGRAPDPVVTRTIATRLDALSAQLDGLRTSAEAIHPDYLALLATAERIERDVAAEVARYRASVR